jgi:hypothetical protein
MSSTQSDPVTSAIPLPRAPENGPDLAPWSPGIPTQRGAPVQRGIRWLDTPPEDTESTRHAPPAGLDALPAHRPRWALIALTIGVVLVVVGVVAVVGIVTLAHRTMTVQGSLVVAGRGGALVPGATCSVSRMPGRSVSIFGPDGSVVASAPLSTGGTATDQWHTAFPYADACRFAFTVTDVPASDDSYRVGLDGNPSDTVPFTRDELTKGAQLTYGH